MAGAGPGVATGVGLVVGLVVGAAVGLVVGFEVGLDVGETVGLTVGLVVADVVGFGVALVVAVGTGSVPRTVNPGDWVKVCWLAPTVRVTLRSPVVAPAGTVAVIWVVESTAKAAGTPLNRT